jgi:hypothetical protein
MWQIGGDRWLTGDVASANAVIAKKQYYFFGLDLLFNQWGLAMAWK